MYQLPKSLGKHQHAYSYPFPRSGISFINLKMMSERDVRDLHHLLDGSVLATTAHPPSLRGLWNTEISGKGRAMSHASLCLLPATSLEGTMENTRTRSDLIKCFLPIVHRDSDSIKQKAAETVTHQLWMRILNLACADGRTCSDFQPWRTGLLLQSVIHRQSEAILQHNEIYVLHPDTI